MAARGELDLSSADQLRDLLMRELSGGKRLLLDLSALEFMDSTGLAVIVNAINSTGRSSSVLELYAELRSQPQRLMELTGVLQSLTLVESVPPLPAA
ncbi:MAG: STAS domain-containing protein [Solirubrobacteraceae bacterium]